MGQRVELLAAQSFEVLFCIHSFQKGKEKVFLHFLFSHIELKRSFLHFSSSFLPSSFTFTCHSFPPAASLKSVIRLSIGGMKELADVSAMKGFVDASPLAFGR